MSRNNLGFVSSRENVNPQDLVSTSKNTEKLENSSISYQQGLYVELGDRRKKSDVHQTDYEPYAHRDVEHPTSTSETMFHLLKGSLGTGILAMPQAFSYSGYTIGIIATIAIGFLTTYCVRILIKSSYELCKRRRVPSMTYPATAKAAVLEGPEFLRSYASASSHIINITLLVYQLGTCCVYSLFIAENLKSALDTLVTPIRLEYYMLIILLPLILINYIRNLKFLAPVSTIANFITFVSFGLILYIIFREPLSFNDRKAVGEVQNFPLFFGTVLFALEAIGVIMPLENEMKNPKKFSSSFGVINVAMTIIILLYSSMGFFGYIRFGDELKGSVTLNLPSDELLSNIVQILLALSIYMTHSLQCYVAIDILWNLYIGKRVKESNKFLGEYAVRTLIVVGTLLVAMAIPRLELFISLFGALCLSALGLGFPAIIEICTFWSVQGRTENTIMIVKNGMILIFGIFGLVIGTYTSVDGLIKSFAIVDE